MASRTMMMMMAAVVILCDCPHLSLCVLCSFTSPSPVCPHVGDQSSDQVL